MTGFPLRPLAQIGETHIAAQTAPDISPGHQRLLIANDKTGRALAVILDPSFIASGDDWLAIAHTAEVDVRLLELLNLCASARFAAPSLVQLTLESPPH